MAGDSVAVDALGLLAEPFDIARAIGDLALGLGERLALLGRHDRGEVVGMLDHQRVEPLEHGGALLAGPRRPGPARRFGRRDGGLRFGHAAIGQHGEHLAGRGIGDLEGLAALRRLDPLPADGCRGRHEAGILEMAGEGFGQRHGTAPFGSARHNRGRAERASPAIVAVRLARKIVPAAVTGYAASGPGSSSPSSGSGGRTARTVSTCLRPSRVIQVIDWPCRSPISAAPTGVSTDTRPSAISALAG